MRTFLIILSAVLLLSCSVTSQNQVSRDVPLRQNKPIVYIKPLTSISKDMKVGVLPFTVPANMPTERGLAVGALFKDVLLRKQAFRTIKQVDKHYGGIDEAIALGRQADVDLILAGAVLYALAGTEFGGARVDVAVRFISVKTGNTVWYIEQSVDQPMAYPKAGMMDRLLASFSSPIRKPQGAPPIPTMMAGIAADIADLISGSQFLSSL